VAIFAKDSTNNSYANCSQTKVDVKICATVERAIATQARNHGGAFEGSALPNFVVALGS